MKKCVSLILAISVVFAIIPIYNIADVQAAEVVWNGSMSNSFDGGTGTENNPYRIATGEQLAYLSYMVNSGTTYSGKYFVLTADIYLNNTSDYDSWGDVAPQNEWTPIGTSSSVCFKGNFDGNNYAIRGLYVLTDGWAGLFGAVEDVEIKNLNIEQAYISGTYAGGLAAYVKTYERTVVFDNITFSGDIIASGSYAGGIYALRKNGWHYAGFAISNCRVYGSIAGTSDVGGIAGTGCPEIRECQVYADVIGSGDRVGGIAGSNATVTDCTMYGSVSGDEEVGGIVGGNSALVIKNCANYATITGVSKVGGIIGLGWSYPDISECYNAGTVTGENWVAGVAGYLSTGGGAKNCYNTGTITGVGAAEFIAGIVGECEFNGAGAFYCYNVGTVINGFAICETSWLGGSIVNCYYLEGCGKSGTGTSLSKKTMSLEESFSSFDFDSVWIMNKAAGRPILRKNLELMSDVSCQLTVLDANTGEPVVGALVEHNDNVVITGGLGTATITEPGQNYTSANYAVITKDGYESFVCYLSDLDVDSSTLVNNVVLMIPDGTSTDEDAANKIYINQHLAFYLDSYNSISGNLGFYNTVWQYEDGKRLWACYTWDVLGDVGEVLTLNFGDLTINADYYDLYVAELILSLVETQTIDQEALFTQAFSIYEGCYSDFSNNFVNNLVAIVEEDELLQQELEDLLTANNVLVTDILTNKELLKSDLGKILRGEETGINTGTRIIYETVCGKALVDESLFSQLFAGFSAANEIASIYTDAMDVIQDVGNACIIAESCVAVNEDVFKILFDASYVMLEGSGSATYAVRFNDSVDKYYDIATDEDALRRYLIFEVNSALLTAAYENVFKDILEAEMYKVVASCFGIGVPQLKALVGTYNGTYKLLDRITKLSEKTEQYYIMNYVAPVESALVQVVGDYGETLAIVQDYRSAQNFDLAYQALRFTNKYLYESAFNFAALRKDAEEMQYFTYYKNAWNLNNCHDNYVIDRSKYISIQCPVDVYLYGPNGNLVVAIIDEEVATYNDELVTVSVCDGKKSIMFPADKKYALKIVSRETGTMEYYVSEADGVSQYRNVEFYDLSLREGQIYTGNIPYEFGINNTEYALTTDSEHVVCDYDSFSSELCQNGHSYGEWATIEEPTCAGDGEKVRICSVCSKLEKAFVIKLDHDLTHHVRKEANHFTSGNIEYWVCDICDRFFNDASANNEITKEDTVIAQIPHNYSVAWVYGISQHWYECACGDKIKVNNHNFDNDCDTACDICGYTRTITHDWSDAWESDATGHWHKCNTSGCTDMNGFVDHTPDHQGGATEEYPIRCSICQYVIEQQLAHPHVYNQEVATDAYKASNATCQKKAVYYKSCKCGEKGTETFIFGDYADHKWNEPTCTTPKICSVCQKTEGDALGHVESTEWKYDMGNHWNECTCGDKANTAAHTDINKDGECDVCEYIVSVADSDNPQTGDSCIVVMWVVLFSISSMGIIATAIYGKRRYL